MTLTDNITGIQHIGLPTNDMQATLRFYESLGFTVDHRAGTEQNPVVFLSLKNLMIETYQNGQATGKPGAIDHISIDVRDVDEAYAEVTKLGYRDIDGLRFLPFWENGVRFFTICGPNAEKIEFNQVL